MGGRSKTLGARASFNSVVSKKLTSINFIEDWPITA